jgi:hypothetical protein
MNASSDLSPDLEWMLSSGQADDETLVDALVGPSKQ